MRLASLLLAVALGACSSDRADDPAPPPPAQPVAITGVNQLIHWSATGDSTAVGTSPFDLYLEADLADGSVVPADLADDGSFSIPVAPSGAYWLRIIDGRTSREDVYLYTDATTLDLGRDRVGNDRGQATSNDTKVVVDADGLSPWQDTDDGDVVIADLGYRSAFGTYFAANTPLTGDQALADLTYFWVSEPLPSTPQGDAALFVQVRTAHDDALGLDYMTPVKMFRSKPLAIADGATATVTGSFVDPPALDIPIHWKRSAFVGLAAATHVPACNAELDSETYWVHALPGHGAHGDLANAFGGAEDIPEFGPRVIDNTFSVDTTDLDGVFHVLDPYPTDWLHARYSVSFSIGCALPGLGAPGNAEAEIGVITDQLGDDPVTPLVGPVSAPQISGRSLDQPQLGVGGTPVISWTAPALGTATSFELHVQELDSSQFGGITLHEVAELVVPGDVTSVTLPRDVLLDGVTYQLQIRAISRAGQAPRTAPFRSGMPLGFADLFTNYFQP